MTHPGHDDETTRPQQTGGGQQAHGSWQQPGPSWQQQPGPYPPGPYGYQAPPAPPPYAADHPQAVLSLVLGVVGVVACGVVAPFAWWLGRRAVREIDASHGRLGGRTLAQVGYVLGIVGTVLLALGALFLGAMLLLTAAPIFLGF